MLLGSTPEIRDIAAEYGLDLTVVDESEKNYYELQGLMMHAGGHETFVKGDWTGMNFISEFDVAIGDSVLSVLSTEDAKKVMEKVHRALTPGGEWITRVMLYESGEDFISPDTLNGRIRNCGTKKDIYEQLFVPFLTYYKIEVGAVKGSSTYERLKRDVDKGLFPEACLEVFNVLRRYPEENFLVERSEFEAYIGKTFSIEKAIDYTEPFSRNWIIYVLKKK